MTDASNASRTLLYDIRAGQWSAELCELFRVPMSALPEVVPSYGVAGHVEPAEFLGLDVPIAGIAGDQQAALFGQACFTPGDTKCTYGTGSFLLVNTGKSIVTPRSGLLSTVAWQEPGGELTYALEGAIFVTGAAVQWLRDGLGIIDAAPQTEALAGTVPDSGGVVFVPALTGLGAPDWDPDARGTILGITRGTTRAHLIRATLEAIAYEVRDVFDLMADRDRARSDAAEGRRRRERQQPPHADAGRSGADPGGASRGGRDHGTRRGLSGRPRHRHVVIARRTCGHVAARPEVRARATRRDRACSLALRRSPRQGLGAVATANGPEGAPGTGRG